MYTLSQICAIFKVTPMTLRRWCRRSNISPCVDPVDRRCRYITDAQLVKLSTLHRRVLIVDASQVQTSELQRLEARIAELEKERLS